ncbi:hypothetical protein [Enterococcus hermanniensis]|uniref:Uncharacterized protein n=1 Tax=Enterococcus hermanniensis TaxID=249189 RepID=A0A1L8TRY5_9ENTE|nr:hypothetical protein [Enterococcus hermanniensis]OJG46938.1 hypothetical protein RV04_GL000185 [Enterococcus hermanniensis]
MMKIVDKIIWRFPLLFSVTICIVNLNLGIVKHDLPGLDKILESVITFTSIIIGVLVALFGVVVTLADKDIMIKLQRNRGDKIIFKYSLETLITNFILLIISIIMQSVLEFSPTLKYVDYCVYTWVFFLIFSIASSIRTIYYLLLISFNQDDKSNRPKSSLKISNEERTKLRMKKVPPQKD